MLCVQVCMKERMYLYTVCALMFMISIQTKKTNSIWVKQGNWRKKVFNHHLTTIYKVKQQYIKMNSKFIHSTLYTINMQQTHFCWILLTETLGISHWTHTHHTCKHTHTHIHTHTDGYMKIHFMNKMAFLPSKTWILSLTHTHIALVSSTWTIPCAHSSMSSFHSNTLLWDRLPPLPIPLANENTPTQQLIFKEIMLAIDAAHCKIYVTICKHATFNFSHQFYPGSRISVIWYT